MMPRLTQGGNAIIYVLVGIFLFGALAFALTRGAQQGSGNLTKHQARLAASEILSYSAQLEKVVDRLRQRGCGELQISFESSATGTFYRNTLSPTDKSCHVFDPNGGNAPLPQASPNMFSPYPNAYYSEGYNGYKFAQHFSVSGVGTAVPSNSGDNFVGTPRNRSAMGLFVPMLKKEICEEINSILNINFILLTTYSTAVGVRVGPGNAWLGTNCCGGYGVHYTRPEFVGKSAGCYYVHTGPDHNYAGPGYQFYYILLAR